RPALHRVWRPPSPTNPGQKKTAVAVKIRRCKNGSQVLCRSDGRIEKDRAIRARHEGRLLADMAGLKARIENRRLVDPIKIAEAIGRLKERYPRVARYYTITHDPDATTLTAVRDEERH